MKYQTVFFDFDGVLSQGYFYSGLKKDHPLAYNFIEEFVFGAASGVADKWMRGQLSLGQVNELVAKNTGLDVSLLENHLQESIARFRIEKRLLDLAKKIQQNSVKVALVTNNADAFNLITIKQHGLDNIFPVIINSCDYGCLKHENNGYLFDVAMQRLGKNSFDGSLLIDDSAKARQTFKQKGGQVFAFTTYENFEPWAKENLV
jgi:FMN phosphatase YigB (HAD superfamily)